jgi:hypothetical protein
MCSVGLAGSPATTFFLIVAEGVFEAGMQCLGQEDAFVLTGWIQPFQVQPHLSRAAPFRLAACPVRSGPVSPARARPEAVT